MSAAPELSPALNQTSPSPAAEAQTSLSETSAAQRSPVPPSMIDTTVDSDDEVQFIFSAPRRRRKKLRRFVPSHISADDLQGPQISPDLLEKGIASYPRRRGTTGMVQRLESCHIRGIEGNLTSGLVRSGSFPSEKPLLDNHSKPRSTIIKQLTAETAPSRFLPFAPFTSMPGPVMQPDDMFMNPGDWTGVRPEDETSKKKTCEEEFKNYMAHPSPDSQDIHACGPQVIPSDMKEIHYDPREPPKTNISTTSSHNTLPASSTMRDFLWKEIPNPIQSHMQSPTTITMAQSSVAGTRTPIFLHHAPAQNQLFIPNTMSMQRKETSTVPARLVPEKSVSPRTQTVEIPLAPSPNQAQARQMMLFQRATNSPSRRGLEVAQRPRLFVPMSYDSQFGPPRSVPPQSSPSQQCQTLRQPLYQNSPSVAQTHPSDVFRKPSLYKVPPWRESPSPIISPSTFPFPSKYMKLSANSRPSDLDLNNIASRDDVFSNTLRLSKPKEYRSPERWPTVIHGMVPMTPPRTLPSQSQARSPFASSPPSCQPQGTWNKRKHSPNLIIDVAETCQEHFPFVTIAERHQVPIQKVFDTFSAVIQLPLLRSASNDNRRHGSLGKRRMKEFRDAKKAMEMATNDKNDVGLTRGCGDGRAKKSAKKGQEQPLLRAAIMNHASRGKEGA